MSNKVGVVAQCKPIKSYSDFRSLIPTKFTAKRGSCYGDFRETVGKQAIRFRNEHLPRTANERDRNTRWTDWMAQVDFGEYNYIARKLTDDVVNDLAQGKRDGEYAVAIYYRFHSLSNDKSFAMSVDKEVFGGPLSEDGIFVFVEDDASKPIEIEHEQVDHVQSAPLVGTLEWRFRAAPNVPFDGQFASFSLEAGQVSKADCPIGIRAELYIDTAYDQESGFRLGFKSAEIVPIIGNENPQPVVEYILSSSDIKTCRDAFYQMKGTDNFRFFRLSKPKGVLEGNYDSLDVILLFQPLLSPASLNAKMTVSIADINISSPDDVTVTSDVKRAFIGRMMAKEMLPEPDPRGDVTVHSVEYIADAVDPGGKR